MRPDYEFSVGQRVTDGNRYGEVTFRCEGGTNILWYFVQWDDGQEDRYTSDDLSAA